MSRLNLDLPYLSSRLSIHHFRPAHRLFDISGDTSPVVPPDFFRFLTAFRPAKNLRLPFQRFGYISSCYPPCSSISCLAQDRHERAPAPCSTYRGAKRKRETRVNKEGGGAKVLLWTLSGLTKPCAPQGTQWTPPCPSGPLPVNFALVGSRNCPCMSRLPSGLEPAGTLETRARSLAGRGLEKRV